MSVKIDTIGRVRTESVKRGSDKHEDIALGTAQCWPIFVGDFIGRNEQSETTNADDNSQHLRPTVLWAHVDPAEE